MELVAKSPTRRKTIFPHLTCFSGDVKEAAGGLSEEDAFFRLGEKVAAMIVSNKRTTKKRPRSWHIRVNQDWLAVVTQSARALDLSVSAYIREAVNRQLAADGFKFPADKA
jgi:hypothetical protein